MAFVSVKELPHSAYPPAAPTNRISLKTRLPRLFVLTKRGWPLEKMSVSPLPGTPTYPQLAESLQLPVAPPPDQLKTAPCELATSVTPTMPANKDCSRARCGRPELDFKE